MRSKNILITGASGFVGTNLIGYLHNNGYVNITRLTRKDLESISLEVMQNVDVVIHLAGKAHDLKKTSDPQEYYSVNAKLTKKLYDVFLQSSADKFIFMSSVKAAADTVNGILTEDDLANPITDYGKSKLMAEKYIINQILPEYKSFFILRPCMIHGPGNKGNLNLLYQFVKRRIPYPLAAFVNERSFLSVENLCFIIKEIVEMPDVKSGIYNLADDETLSTNELVKIIANESGNKALLWVIPKRVVYLFAKIGDLMRLPLNTERLNKLTENYCVSNNKIKLALGKSLPLSARDGLAETVTSFNDK